MKEDKMGGSCSTHENDDKCCSVWPENLKGRKIPYGRWMHKWKKNVRMDV
jgi:hypothetical protein